MTETVATIRTATLYELIARCNADSRLGSAKILDGAPGTEWPDEAIGFGRIVGTTPPAAMKSGRKAGEDRWELHWIVWATATGQDARVACARAEQLAQILYDVVMADCKLGGSVAGLQSIQISTNDGPDRYAGDEGMIAESSGVIVCNARIS